MGANIVKRAREEPLRLIVQNSGVEGGIVVEEVHNHNNVNYGFNAATGQYEDLAQAVEATVLSQGGQLVFSRAIERLNDIFGRKSPNW